MEEQGKYSLCYGCLSMDRHVKPMKKHADLFVSLLGLHLIDLKWLNTELCWECLAWLRQVHNFRIRIQRAHTLLSTIQVTNHVTLEKLTTLSINKKDIYDATIEYDETEIKNDNKEITNTIEEVKVKIEEEDLADLHDLIDDHDTSYEDLEDLQNIKKYESDLEYKYRNGSIPNGIKENNIITTNDEKSINVIATKNKVDKNTKTKVQSKEKVNKDIKYDEFLNHATVVKNDIDIENVSKYFVTVNLNKEEYEELLEKKRKSIDYVTMDHKCELCICGFTTHSLLQYHKRHYHIKTSEPFRCLRCKRSFPTRHAMLVHASTQHSMMRCSACDYLCWGRSMPVTHLKTHLFTYTCNFCSERFNSLVSFVVHYKKHHSKYICDRCGRLSTHRRAMEKHLRNHHDLCCRECNKPVGSRAALRLHMASVHAAPREEGGREANYCVECDKQFPNEYKFRKHLRIAIKHNPPKRIALPCPDCGKEFTRATYMRNHYKLYHLKKNDHYCETCDKYFVSGFSLRNHRWNVHEKRAKPRDKVCNLCGRAFHTNRILNNHVRTHTGEKPYTCKHCGTSFAQKTALKSHERSRHKNL